MRRMFNGYFAEILFFLNVLISNYLRIAQSKTKIIEKLIIRTRMFLCVCIFEYTYVCTKRSTQLFSRINIWSRKVNIKNQLKGAVGHKPT